MVTVENPHLTQEVSFAVGPTQPIFSHLIPEIIHQFPPTIALYESWSEAEKKKWQVGTAREIVAHAQAHYNNPELTLDTLLGYLNRQGYHIDIQYVANEGQSIYGGLAARFDQENIYIGTSVGQDTDRSISLDEPLIYRFDALPFSLLPTESWESVVHTRNVELAIAPVLESSAS